MTDLRRKAYELKGQLQRIKQRNKHPHFASSPATGEGHRKVLIGGDDNSSPVLTIALTVYLSPLVLIPYPLKSSEKHPRVF